MTGNKKPAKKSPPIKPAKAAPKAPKKPEKSEEKPTGRSDQGRRED